MTTVASATGSVSAVPAWASPSEDVLRDVGSSPLGLDGSTAQARLVADGPNRLPDPAVVPAWRRFLHHFDDVLVYILVAAAVLKAISGDWVDFAVIAAVIVANAIIGYVQEGRAANALASLATMVSLDAQVRRSGARLVVMMIPDEYQVHADVAGLAARAEGGTLDAYDLERPQRELGRALREEGIDALDLLPAFRERGTAERLYVPRDTHWNRSGHRLAAERLAAHLERSRP